VRLLTCEPWANGLALGNRQGRTLFDVVHYHTRVGFAASHLEAPIDVRRDESSAGVKERFTGTLRDLSSQPSRGACTIKFLA